MNMIVCDQHCRHQEEGYCTLNQIARLSNDASTKCGYFEALNVKANQAALTQDAERL